MAAWGFAYRTSLCWVKPSIGPGNWARQRHELVLVGTRGGVGTPREEDRPDSVIEAPRGRHSQKPDRALRAHRARVSPLDQMRVLCPGDPARGLDCLGQRGGGAMSEDRLLTAQEVAEILAVKALLGAGGHARRAPAAHRSGALPPLPAQ